MIAKSFRRIVPIPSKAMHIVLSKFMKNLKSNVGRRTDELTNGPTGRRINAREAQKEHTTNKYDHKWTQREETVLTFWWEGRRLTNRQMTNEEWTSAKITTHKGKWFYKNVMSILAQFLDQHVGVSCNFSWKFYHIHSS